MTDKSPSPAFLNRAIYTTSHVYECLKELAEVQQTTPDALATNILAEHVGTVHLDWLVRMARADREKRMQEYLKRTTSNTEEDQLP